ncbi:MAG: hypothetical protein WC700_19430 [Gemmatimonadaceae bacterium]|jgi:hypothetical protein
MKVHYWFRAVALLGVVLALVATPSRSAAQTSSLTIVAPTNGTIAVYDRVINGVLLGGPLTTCPTQCSRSGGTGGGVVHILAHPAPGYKLAAYGGACLGWPTDRTVGPTFGICQLTLYTATVSATFVEVNPRARPAASAVRRP